MKNLDNELILYAIYGDLEAVRKMLRQGADVNTPNSGTTPLYEAVSKGNTPVIDELLKCKNIETNKYASGTGYTALHGAVFYSFHCDDSESGLLLQKLLEDNRFNIRIPSRAPLTIGFTPLHLAAYIGYSKGIELLIKAGAMPTDTTIINKLSVYDIAGKKNNCDKDNTELVKFIDEIVSSTNCEVNL